MAIDPSIALNSGGQTNLLQTLAGATQLRGNMQSQAANKALSTILQQSVDPQTGQVDYDKVTKLAAQDPNAAYNLPALQAQILSQRTNQLQYDTSKLEQASKRSDLLSNGFGSLLASGNVTPQGVMNIATQGIKAGLFTPEDAVNFTSDMPTDPAALQQWAKQHYIGFSGDSARIQNLMPKQVSVNTGAQQVNYNVDPFTGAATGTQQIFNNQLTPGDAATPTQIYDPATQSMRMITKGQFANSAENAAAPGAQPQVPSATGVLGSGRMNPTAPQQGGTQPAAAPVAPGIQAAPSLGSAEAANVTAQGAAQGALALNNQASAAPQSIYQFQNMREALKGISTGPGTDWRQQAKSFVTALSPDIAAKVGIDPNQVANADEFKKYATLAVQSSLASLGEGTDAKLASAYASNPGPGLSKLANENLIDVAIAGQRAIAAKNNAWQTSGLPPEQFNRFSNEWNQTVDPRIFTLEDMPRDKAIAMRNSLKPTEQKKFDQSYNAGVQRGLIQRIGQ